MCPIWAHLQKGVCVQNGHIHKKFFTDLSGVKKCQEKAGIKFCIANGIMKGYLEEHSEEVFNMLALEWDKNLALQARFDDGFDSGIAKGIESVAMKMISEGETPEKICKFTALPMNRIEELVQKIKNE